ncbi:MAG: DUF3288 family protein [Spirulinaceae cyanobacterium SM2_1_0]|nr:DUF3288 family protein [Spirulinaceae cyanobacterium SM2_1_0]
MAQQTDQQHPQEQTDQALVERILQAGQTDQNLIEVARLHIRYQNFPGARALQQQLAQILQAWGLSETELMARSRQLYVSGQVARQRQREEQQDWS